MENYTGVVQFDFQIVRFINQLKHQYSEVREDLKVISHSVYDFESWYQWWYKKRHKNTRKVTS